MPRKAPKRDSAERDIIQTLRAIGATVAQLDDKDIPDLLVGWRSQNYLMEVKSGKYGKLSEGQQQWHAEWNGQVAVVKSAQEALEVLGLADIL